MEWQRRILTVESSNRVENLQFQMPFLESFDPLSVSVLGQYNFFIEFFILRILISSVHFLKRSIINAKGTQFNTHTSVFTQCSTP